MQYFKVVKPTDIFSISVKNINQFDLSQSPNRLTDSDVFRSTVPSTDLIEQHTDLDMVLNIILRLRKITMIKGTH